ncbi:uncharacterized protein LOC125861306 [Solanum stenotomum]|uniref:uncharacterized protein LOC125861306 n=1 Tax=Solanum stenotomum TaxID=172797 RepID=UPI0020D16582|nr:uncharacterized protein LOC125861306 [Solanum stenotomum]
MAGIVQRMREMNIALHVAVTKKSLTAAVFSILFTISTLLNTLGSEESIYQKVSFEDFPLFSWYVRTREQINERAYFMSRCMNVGNKEALYKVGMMDFFKNNCPELALQRLWDAKKRGHNGATYVLAIIFIFAGGNDSSDAVKFIGQMKENLPQRRESKEWRESLINIIDNVWVSNSIFFMQRPDLCCTSERESPVRVNGWPVDSDEELDDQPCYEYACDVEVDHVFDILSKFGL